MNTLTPLGHDIYQIDLVPEDSLYRTTGYIIRGSEKTIIIETGASRSNKAILKALEELVLTTEDIDIIAVTHIHLDHSGGAGRLMSQCPNARLLAHEKGKKHLAYPEKLVSGAKEIYGRKFDSLFNPIVPIDPDRIEVKEDGTECNIGNNRCLKFFDVQGHAFHHFIIFDPVSNGIFSGDSAGIYFRRIKEDYGVDFCIPATVPTQFIPELLEKTVSDMISLNPDRIYFAHFGMSKNATSVLEQSRKWIPFFGEECVKLYQRERSGDKLVKFAQQRLHQALEESGVPSDFPDKPHLLEDIKLNVQGVIAYASRLEKEERT